MNAKPSRRTFRLIDLIVVLAVVALAFALLSSGVQRQREAARRCACLDNFCQLGLGVNDFLTRWRVYPSACSVDKEPETGKVVDVGFQPNSRVGWSWIVQILPQVEEAELYQTLHLKEAGPLVEPPGAGTPHKHAMNTTFGQLTCPSFRGDRWRDPQARTEAITNYKAMGATHLESLKVATPQHDKARPGYTEETEGDLPIHPDGAIFPGALLDDRDFAADGAAHTIFLCESVEQSAARWTVGMETELVALPPEVTYVDCGGYFAPDGFDGQFDEQSGVRKAHNDWQAYVGYDYKNGSYHDYTGGTLRAIYGPSSHHPGCVIHGFGDNHARPINYDIDLALYMFLITRNGHDPAGDFFAE